MSSRTRRRRRNRRAEIPCSAAPSRSRIERIAPRTNAMSRKPRILLTGATGQVGKGVIPYLAADKSVEVIAAVRSPAKAASLGIASVYLDLDRVETMAPALAGIDRLFVVTGY